jgi:serine/threonine protein kinase
MPAHFMTFPNGSPILPVRRHGRLLRPSTIVLDAAYLSSFGVFKAKRSAGNSEEWFVLKFPPEGATPHDENCQRLRRECSNNLQVQHLNVVHVVDHGLFDQKWPCLVFPYIHGEDLKDFVKTHSDIRLRLVLFEQLCDAVQALHGNCEKGLPSPLFHRDIKPSNVRVDFENHIHLLDFGLVKSSSASDDVTKPRAAGPTPGTLEWMAPEQAYPISSPDRKGRELSGPRTDVHALGLLLTWLLTDKRAYDLANKTDRAKIDIIRIKRPRTPSELRPGFTRAFDSLILECLRKDPDARPPDAAMVKRRLREILDNPGQDLGQPYQVSKRDVLFERPILASVLKAMEDPPTQVHLHGVRWSGKTELLKNVLRCEEERGARAVWIDFEELSESETQDPESSCKAIAEGVAGVIDPEMSVEALWDHSQTPFDSFIQFLKTEIIERDDRAIWIGLDNADRNPDRTEVFGLMQAVADWQRQSTGRSKAKISFVVAYRTHPPILQSQAGIRFNEENLHLLQGLYQSLVGFTFFGVV